MESHLIGRENVSPCRLIVRLVARRFIERIHDELTVDQDRLLALLVVEQDTPAEATLRFLARLREHGVGPPADHSCRSSFLRLVFVAETPRVIQTQELRRLPFPGWQRART